MNSLKIHSLGLPRIGPQRELKKAVEAFWKGSISTDELEVCGAEIRRQNRQLQQDLDFFPVNDFSFYDQMLDMSCLLGVIPSRIKRTEQSEVQKYFSMARGSSCTCASEMTKWFNTNYHYIVPEIDEQTSFEISSTKIFDEYLEAGDSRARPVLIGPVTYLSLAGKEGGDDKLQYLDKVLSVYSEILARLKTLGCEWVQIDEPIFSTDLSALQKEALLTSYDELSVLGPQLLLTNYFGALGENLELFFKLPVHGFHVDAVEGRDELSAVVDQLPKGVILSLGVIDGRNIWRSDFKQILDLVRPVVARLGGLWLAPSCSLLHVPYSLDNEGELDPEVKHWLAFAKEKIGELSDLKSLLTGKLGNDYILFENQQAIGSRKVHPQVNVAEVRQRLSAVSQNEFCRAEVYEQRRVRQAEKFNLPLLPTTTIGSFPQTKEVRQQRALHKKGQLSSEDYDRFLAAEISQAIEIQNDLGLDILVHGEPERNDMVEYFGEQLNGYVFTKNAWVQSYGSRCVKPPIIYGDISRKHAMTVKWSQFAQEVAGDKPMKGMLTGPITMLKWSFGRDDLSAELVAKQIALALRDEILDLEEAGIEIIQVDEPAIREGLPLKKEDKEAYLQWAVGSFKLSTASVKSTTQIHTHMCYSDFNEIIEAIAALDADVISVETSRSQQSLLEVFKRFKYPNEIGPGVYDIHSPRVPTVEEMIEHIRAACEYIDIEKLWINPDCGLKTRDWPETKEALKNMIQAVNVVREELSVLA